VGVGRLLADFDRSNYYDLILEMLMDRTYRTTGS